MKTCYKCKKLKDMKDFHRDSSKRDGLESLCIECKSEYDKKRRSTQEGKEKTKINNILFKLNNPDYFVKWFASHKNQVAEKKKDRTMSDVIFKIKNNLIARFNQAIRKNYKSGSAVRDLGCSVEEFKLWIEQQFYSNPETGEIMSWENYGKGLGKWNIDHIIPLTKVDLTDRKQVKKVCHWFNLRPMWAKENFIRGNRI